MNSENHILKAKFNTIVCTYWLLSGALILTVTIVGIPLLLLWFPIGKYFTKRYLDRMDCILTDKTLIVRKGIFVRVEKIIPLEKITDMGMVQGPIMRYYKLHKLTIETAGQSSQGALVSLIGITKVKSFRETVLKQRDMISPSSTNLTQAAESERPTDNGTLLSEIRDSLLRIEAKLDRPSN